MSYKALTQEEVEQFMEKGWVRVEEAFSPQDALVAQEYLWGKLEERGITRDKSTWPDRKYTIEESYNSPQFQVCNTARLLDAIEDLVGAGRTIASRDADVRWGWWQINFQYGADRAWDVPKVGWHYDGIHFKHFLDSPEQGLLLLCLFSDIQPQGGGTLAVEGSHHLIARILKEHKDGLDLRDANRLAYQHPYIAEIVGLHDKKESEDKGDIYAHRDEVAVSTDENRIEKLMNSTYHDPEGYSMRVIETTGGPGDAILCHPFLMHTPSQNHRGVPRFMCNRTTPLKERMNFHRSNPTEYSPLELSIRRSVFE